MYTEEHARQLVIEAGLKLVEDGLVARTWGNVSARCGEDEMIITPSGVAYDVLRPEDLVKVNIYTLEYDGDRKPSSEKGIHAAVYESRPDIHFVIHTHQTYASAVAADEQDTPFAPCADYGLPGTDHLKKKVIKKLLEHPGHKTFLMAKHGALILGENMDEAFELADMLEIKCREQFAIRVPSMDGIELQHMNVQKFQSKFNPFVKLVQDEFIAECCHAGVNLKPYLDDFAQMVGPDMRVVDDSKRQILAGMIDRNAVLIRSVGALCYGKTEDDCEAVATIVSKNCAAACYVRKAPPLTMKDAILQRIVYKTSYSKKRNG